MVHYTVTTHGYFASGFRLSWRPDGNLQLEQPESDAENVVLGTQDVWWVANVDKPSYPTCTHSDGNFAKLPKRAIKVSTTGIKGFGISLKEWEKLYQTNCSFACQGSAFHFHSKQEATILEKWGKQAVKVGDYMVFPKCGPTRGFGDILPDIPFTNWTEIEEQYGVKLVEGSVYYTPSQGMGSLRLEVRSFKIRNHQKARALVPNIPDFGGDVRIELANNTGKMLLDVQEINCKAMQLPFSVALQMSGTPNFTRASIEGGKLMASASGTCLCMRFVTPKEIILEDKDVIYKYGHSLIVHPSRKGDFEKEDVLLASEESKSLGLDAHSLMGSKLDSLYSHTLLVIGRRTITPKTKYVLKTSLPFIKQDVVRFKEIGFTASVPHGWWKATNEELQEYCRIQGLVRKGELVAQQPALGPMLSSLPYMGEVLPKEVFEGMSIKCPILHKNFYPGTVDYNDLSTEARAALWKRVSNLLNALSDKELLHHAFLHISPYSNLLLERLRNSGVAAHTVADITL